MLNLPRHEGEAFAEETVDEARAQQQHHQEHDRDEQVGCDGRDGVDSDDYDDADSDCDAETGDDVGRGFVDGDEGETRAFSVHHPV